MSDDKIIAYLAFSEKRPDLPEFDESIQCECKGKVGTSYGLGGGGMGVYSFCEECGKILSKSITEGDD